MVARAVVLVHRARHRGRPVRPASRLLTRTRPLGRPIDRHGDVGRRVAREAGQVLGQRKLFQRALPGLMHACIFWGFLVLLTTIVEALGQAIDPGFALPWIGHAGWLGLAAGRVRRAACWSGSRSPSWIRLVQRPERFVGSHRLDAFRILGLITWIILTLFLLRGARIALGVAAYPTAWTPMSTAVSHLFTWMSAGLAVVLRVVLPVGAPRARAGVPGLPAVLEAPAHHHERDQRVVREHPPARRARAAADRHGEARVRRAIARRRDAVATHPQGAAGPLRVHRMRPVPERLPRMEHGQTAVARSCSSWTCATTSSKKDRASCRCWPRARLPTRWRWCRRSSTTTSCGRARRAARAFRSAPWTSSTSTRSSTSAGRS